MQVGLMMGIMAEWKEEERKTNLSLCLCLSSLPVCTHPHRGKATWRPNEKTAICKPGSGPSPNTAPAYILTLDLPASRTVDNEYFLFKLLGYGIYYSSPS